MSSPVSPEAPTPAAAPTLPFRRARLRDAGRIAELLAFAFTLDSKSSATRGEQFLVRMTLPGMLLSTLLGIALRQFWWRPGVTLQLED